MKMFDMQVDAPPGAGLQVHKPSFAKDYVHTEYLHIYVLHTNVQKVYYKTIMAEEAEDNKIKSPEEEEVEEEIVRQMDRRIAFVGDLLMEKVRTCIEVTGQWPSIFFPASPPCYPFCWISAYKSQLCNDRPGRSCDCER